MASAPIERGAREKGMHIMTIMMRGAVAAALGVALISPVSAQSIGMQGGAFSRAEGSVSVGLTVPLGDSRQRDAPRIELRLARDVVNADGSRLSDRLPYRLETRLGLSLTREPRLTLNGRSIDRDRRQGLSTLGWVAIGVGVAVVTAGVVAWESLEAASD